MSLLLVGTKHLSLARSSTIQNHFFAGQFATLFGLRNQKQDYAAGHRFSTFRPLRTESSKNSVPNGKPGGPPELPKFSLQALGLSKRQKMIILVLFSIAGTIETWFYAQNALRWWRNRKKAESGEDVSTSVD